jgi:hypothetical protein
MAMTACRSLTSLEVETHAASLSEFPIIVKNQVSPGSLTTAPDTAFNVEEHAALITTVVALV